MLTDTPLRFTFVIARYGAGILGGAERLARSVAERLVARGHDVRVLTSCASSYVTWANELAPGSALEGGVEVRRYPANQRRTPGDDVLKWLSSQFPGQSWLARAWARAQGPVVPDLVARLPLEARERDLLVFFQLLAYPTLFGLPAVADKSVLVPLVHQERGVDTVLARRTLALPRALLVNTDREAAAIVAMAPSGLPPVRIVAVGLDAPEAPPARAPDLPRPYVVVMGRAGKLKPLLRTWRALATGTGLAPLGDAGQFVPWDRVHLVIVGEHAAGYGTLPNVIQTGYVDEATRSAILAGAVALVNPSLYESLSLVVLEAWTEGRPVVVNARCDVTADLARRSGGGLVVDFEHPASAAAAIAAGLEHERDRQDMGRLGRAFASTTFEWSHVLDEYEAIARAVKTGTPLASS